VTCKSTLFLLIVCLTAMVGLNAQNFIDEAPRARRRPEKKPAVEPATKPPLKSAQISTARPDARPGPVPGLTHDLLSRTSIKVYFTAEGAVFADADLRKLNEANKATIANTDDRITLATSTMGLQLEVPVTANLFFACQVFKSGLWGSDRLSHGPVNAAGREPFQFAAMHVTGSWLNGQVAARIGRQHFSIGGLDTADKFDEFDKFDKSIKDYIFSDYLDAVTLAIKGQSLGQFRILVVDVLHAAGKPDNIEYLRYLAPDTTQVDNFKGETSVLRTGLIYDSLDLLTWKPYRASTGGLQARLYGFFARYGAVKTSGADRAALGVNGNSPDNDYNTLFGARFTWYRRNFKIFTDMALSKGQDRKSLYASGANKDIRADGYAFGLGLQYLWPSLFAHADLQVTLNGFYASGPEFNDRGTQTSHGFVSFKGLPIGGLLFSRYYGAHASAHTEPDGLAASPFDYRRASGTAFAHLGVSLTMGKTWQFDLDSWFFLDTGKTSVTKALGAAHLLQERLGRVLGVEVNSKLTYNFDRHWSLYAHGGAFLPGKFYQSDHFTTTAAPRGNALFWGVLLGSKLVF